MTNTTNNPANTVSNTVDFGKFKAITINSERIDSIKALYGEAYLSDKPDSSIKINNLVLWTWSPSIKTEASRLLNSKEHKSLEAKELGKLVADCWLYASKYIYRLANSAVVCRVEKDATGKVTNVILSFKPSAAMRLAECEEALKGIEVDTTTMNMTEIRIWSYSMECFIDSQGNRISGGLNATSENSMD